MCRKLVAVKSSLMEEVMGYKFTAHSLFSSPRCSAQLKRVALIMRTVSLVFRQAERGTVAGVVRDTARVAASYDLGGRPARRPHFCQTKIASISLALFMMFLIGIVTVQDARIVADAARIKSEYVRTDNFLLGMGEPS